MNAPARIRPSRRYMIQQAVLNAAHSHFPLPTSPSGCVRWLNWLTRDASNLPGWFEASVCREFRALNERWTA